MQRRHLARPLIAAALLLLGVTVCLASELSDSQRRIRELEATQRELIAATTAPGKKTNTATSAEVTRQEALIEAELKNTLHKGFVGPQSSDPVLRAYMNDWTQQILRYGNAHFPRAGGKSLYGSVQVQVTLDPDGKLIEAELLRAAPNPVFNRAVLQMIREAAPFAPFSPVMRTQYSALALVRTLNFTREGNAAH